MILQERSCSHREEFITYSRFVLVLRGSRRGAYTRSVLPQKKVAFEIRRVCSENNACPLGFPITTTSREDNSSSVRSSISITVNYRQLYIYRIVLVDPLSRSLRDSKVCASPIVSYTLSPEFIHRDPRNAIYDCGTIFGSFNRQNSSFFKINNLRFSQFEQFALSNHDRAHPFDRDLRLEEEGHFRLLNNDSSSPISPRFFFLLYFFLFV